MTRVPSARDPRLWRPADLAGRHARRPNRPGNRSDDHAEPHPAGGAPRRHAARRERLPAQPRDRSDRLPHGRRPVRDPGHPAIARPRLRRGARLRWALPSTPARSAWRWRASLVAFFSRRIRRRAGIAISLALLSIPTALLATAPDLATFTALRVVQGVFMSAAFTLTLAYLGERCSAERCRRRARRLRHRQCREQPVRPPALGRLSPTISGLATNFYVFALLNLSGAVLVWFWLGRTPVDDWPRSMNRPRRSRPGPSTCATRRCAAASPSAF